MLVLKVNFIFKEVRKILKYILFNYLINFNISYDEFYIYMFGKRVFEFLDGILILRNCL